MANEARSINANSPNHLVETGNSSQTFAGKAAFSHQVINESGLRFLMAHHENGITRFNIIEEIDNGKPFREFKVNYNGFENDENNNEENINFSDLNLIFNDLKRIFEKQGYTINWTELEKQSLDQTINTLSMASPFSKEEKQMLLEAKDLEFRKQKLEQIIKLYRSDDFSNKTLQ